MKYIIFDFDGTIGDSQSLIVKTLQDTMRARKLEDSLTIWADEDKLDKICFNLLSNAMKFTQAGGKVEFGLDVISRCGHRTRSCRSGWWRWRSQS